MTEPVSSTGPMGQAREGMAVFGSDGQEIGTVREVRMGDERAVTSQGQGREVDEGIIGDIADVFGAGASLSPQARERLARLGYLRIDAHGLFTGDRYVTSGEIADVEDDAIHLTVPADHLLG